MVVSLDEWAEDQFAAVRLRWPSLYVISGHRDTAEQAAVNPSAPNSLHTRCPSLAVDLRVGDIRASITPEAQWAWLGARWQLMGGRWGGRFRSPDLNHFDLGVQLPPPALPLPAPRDL